MLTLQILSLYLFVELEGELAHMYLAKPDQQLCTCVYAAHEFVSADQRWISPQFLLCIR